MGKLTIRIEDSDETVVFNQVSEDKYLGQHNEDLILLWLDADENWQWAIYAVSDSGSSDSKDHAVKEALEAVDVFVSTEDLDDKSDDDNDVEEEEE
jgi:hypothetical protein